MLNRLLQKTFKLIRKAIWHIRRHLNELLNSQDEKYRKHEMFHLRSSIECLERVMNNEKPYPPMDREDFKSHCIYYIIKFSIKKVCF